MCDLFLFRESQCGGEVGQFYLQCAEIYSQCAETYSQCAETYPQCAETSSGALE
jgi:hypothetical protein